MIIEMYNTYNSEDKPIWTIERNFSRADEKMLIACSFRRQSEIPPRKPSFEVPSIWINRRENLMLIVREKIS